MELIKFKNKPNTDTPINDINLNHNFKEIKEKIENDICLKNFLVATTKGTTTMDGNTTLSLLQISNSSGSKLTLENGFIKIGVGVSKVRVSGSIFMDIATQGNGYFWTRLIKNNIAISGVLNPLLTGMAFVSSAVPTTIINVEEGDLLGLNVDAASVVGTVRNGSATTWLCVEVIE